MIRFSRYLAEIGGLIVFTSAILVSLDIVWRKIYGPSPFYSFEMSTYGLALATALGLAFTLLTGGHIRIDSIHQRLGLRLRAALDVLAIMLMTFLAIGLTYYAYLLTADNQALGARSNTSLGVLIYAPQAFWVAGLVWFCIACLTLMTRALGAFKQRRYEDVTRLVSGSDLD